MVIEEIIKEMYKLVDKESQIISPLPGILIAEIVLLKDHKPIACRKLRTLVKLVDDAKYQTILTVLDDDNDRYVRLISNSIKTNSVNTDNISPTSH